MKKQRQEKDTLIGLMIVVVLLSINVGLISYHLFFLPSDFEEYTYAVEFDNEKLLKYKEKFVEKVCIKNEIEKNKYLCRFELIKED